MLYVPTAITLKLVSHHVISFRIPGYYHSSTNDDTIIDSSG